MRYQHSGKIILYTYEKQPMFVKKLQKSDIVEKIKTWINDENLAKKYLPMVKEKHPDIYEQCKR